MRIKQQLGFYLIPVKTTKIKNTVWQFMLKRMWDKNPPLLVKMQTDTAALNISMVNFQN